MSKDDDHSDLDPEASWLNLGASTGISSWTHMRELREKNKTMRRIFEEANMIYGRDINPEDVSAMEELRKRTMIALDLRHKQVKGVLQKMSSARLLELCFLVDVTGSMSMQIAAVKNHIRAIVDRLTKVRGQTNTTTTIGSDWTEIGTASASVVKKIRLAFVGYRDFNDSPCDGPQFEVLDFTDSVDAFHAFCGSIAAKGGGNDAVEDVFGGLEKAIALNWSTDGSTRMLFHIADYPCHGREFHGGISDMFPDGDPLGRSHHSLLGQLADKEIFYHFGKITNRTNKMIRKFAAAYDGEFIVCDLEEADRIFENVVSTASIAVSRIGPGPSHRFKKSDFDTSQPKWGALPVLQCLLLSYELPNSLKDVIAGVPLKQKKPLKADVQIAVKPFAAGAERMAFRGRDVTNPENPVDIVLKKYTTKDGKMTLDSSIHYESAVQMQTIAAYLASKFNKELLEKAGVWPITFLKTQLLSYMDAASGQRVFMSCEKSYPAGLQYLRFTNNMEYAMLELTAKLKNVDMAFVEQLFAFSHWTYQISGGQLMVVDLQGIIFTGTHDHPTSIELTDPAIHCTDWYRFGRTNMGLEGMRLFFSSHQCNDICAKMGLTVPERFRNKVASDE